MKLFACMCNQPQRLAAALAPVRATLVAQPPISRWGLGYIQGGDVLLVRTPKSSATPVDLAGPLSEIATDCAIAQAVNDERGAYAGTDNTQPFRYRRWLFAQSGVDLMVKNAAGALVPAPEIGPRLLGHVPEYLRRNIKGRTPGELIFHLFLSMLHDEGNIDDPNLPTAATRRALSATLRLVASELEKLEIPHAQHVLGNVALTNGRSMVVARLDDPLKLRRLTVSNERGETEKATGSVDAFRGVLLVSGGDGDAREGFEDVPARHTVLVSRDLQITFADLAP
jgi:predicted glutamine amidotransferase